MLTERRDNILKIIVSEYINAAAAVGSESIVRKHRLRVSPATVRNEMATLEEEGFITRPHPSAGGVPSDKGYRYYVEATPSTDTLPPAVKRSIRRRLAQVDPDTEVYIDAITRLVAEIVSNIAVTTFPRVLETRLRHLELVRLQAFLALLVVVLQDATLRKRVVSLPEPMDQEGLTAMANELNAVLGGGSRWEVRDRLVEFPPLQGQIAERVAGVLEHEDERRDNEYALHGLRQLLAQPEFAEGGRARDAVEVLEDHTLLQQVLAQAPDEGHVRVVIGSEHPHDALQPFSVVVCQYGLPVGAVGSLGVIGPTRMDYLRTIAVMRYASSALSDLLGETPAS